MIGMLSWCLLQIPEALKYARRALSLRCDHLHSLHLLALLLSAQKQYQKALELIDTSALAEHQEHFGSEVILRS